MFRLAERRLCYCWGGSMSESQIDGTLAQMVDWGVERQATRDETTMNTYRRRMAGDAATPSTVSLEVIVTSTINNYYLFYKGIIS